LPDFKKSIYESSVLSQLIGRLSLKNYLRRKQFSDDESIPIELPTVLKEALKWFQSKGVINKLEFIKLSAEQRWKSFTVAKVTEDSILEGFKGKIIDYLDMGKTLNEFTSDIYFNLDKLGLTKLNNYHLNTVFVTNALSGYSEGRKQVVDKLSTEEFPFRQVVGVGDDRERESHLEIDGFTAPKDDPVWEWLKTPFSWNCRCEIVPVHRSEGATASVYVPDIRGKKGFEFLS
jgi:hypothetical protein